MESSMDTRVESDKKGFVQFGGEDSGSDDGWRSLSSLKARFCSNRYVTIPIAISIVSLFLVIGTIFGVAIRWTQMNDHINRLETMINDLQGNSGGVSRTSAQTSKSAGSISTSYTRWGRSSCAGGDANLVYSGFTAASSPSSNIQYGGGGVNYLCFPTNPQYNKFDMSNDTAAHSWVYSVEYLSFDLGIFPDNVHGGNVPCSVCLAPRSTKLMIPARRECPSGWNIEYEGYLMTSYVQQSKMDFICVDSVPDVIAGTQNITGGGALYFAAGQCGAWGGLSYCEGSYATARELSCVVCTK